jgi:hypothetical protein
MLSGLRSGSLSMKLPQIRDVTLLLFIVAGIYFGLTWFFFGASHPCEIYYRMLALPALEEEPKNSST